MSVHLETNEPFIYPHEVEQVFYTDDRLNRGWKLIVLAEPRAKRIFYQPQPGESEDSSSKEDTSRAGGGNGGSLTAVATESGGRCLQPLELRLEDLSEFDVEAEGGTSFPRREQKSHRSPMKESDFYCNVSSTPASIYFTWVTLNSATWNPTKMMERTVRRSTLILSWSRTCSVSGAAGWNSQDMTSGTQFLAIVEFQGTGRAVKRKYRVAQEAYVVGIPDDKIRWIIWPLLYSSVPDRLQRLALLMMLRQLSKSWKPMLDDSDEWFEHLLHLVPNVPTWRLEKVLAFLKTPDPPSPRPCRILLPEFYVTDEKKIRIQEVVAT